jgi:uncharacterized protein
MNIIAALSGRLRALTPAGRISHPNAEETTMDDFPTTRVSPVTIDAAAERVSAFLRTVYGWMFVGLGVTAAVAYAVASSPAIMQTLASNHLLFVGTLIAELGLVFYLSARVQHLMPNAAMVLFLLYSALNGVTLSVLLLAYTGGSIATTFVATAGMFGALAVFGSTTKRSLAGVGQFLYMGLIGLVLASILGLFWHNDALQFLISVVGVIVFTGLTAWDAQRLKQMAARLPQGQHGSYAIVGALSLYLNFVNLFLMLLRLQGGRRT